MKIMLINPPNCGRSIPEEEYGITSLRQIFKGEPFNLEILAGPLKDHEVMISDLKCETEDAFWKTFDEFQPDVVGLTAVTCEANTVIRLARKIKEKRNPVIVIGGNHATYDPGYFNRAEFDYIAIGLGKKSFRELIGALADGKKGQDIAGIAETSPGKPLTYATRNYDETDLMDEVPPRYDLVAKYRNQYFLEQLGLTMGFVITAYGCTHKCSFCTIPKMTGGKYLNHSADAVIRDIQMLGDISFIRMVDANTFGNLSLSLDLYKKIMQSGIRKKFFADVRADTIVKNPALMKNWKEAGLYAVVVGFEDFQDTRLSAYNKKYQGHVIHEAIDILHDLGIVIVGDFIASPEYDEKDFEALENFIAAHRIEIPVISVLTPIPGTPLYKKMKKDIIISDLDYYTFTNAVTKTKMPAAIFYKTFADLVKRLHERPHKPN
ncbi:MAG: B12-binding domain-containing radical SAM protein [Deltaproteobacteria bacterium HGW-Deltaproteobacteria-13]|nr:MAG: B12-binding domain-containing radical SAM protein [Deltaproteobacteria bacterium HGW-Deltaproteobacteria-13]